LYRRSTLLVQALHAPEGLPMFKSITETSAARSAVSVLAAIGCAAVAAMLIVALTATAPPAVAEPIVASKTATVAPPADGATRTTGSACSARGWPNYEQGCQFDLRKVATQTVRVIALR